MGNPKIFLCEPEELPLRVVIGRLTLLFVIGFVLRLVAAQWLLGGLDRGFVGDEGNYASLAKHITDGIGFTDNSGKLTSYRTPGLPLLVSVPTGLLGPNIIGIRIFMCFIEALLVPAFYLLLESVTGSAQLAFVAGAMAIFFPSWIIPSGAVMGDIPAAILVTLLAWMLIESYRRQSLLWIAGAGVLWGAATITRAGSITYAPAIILWLLIIVPGWKKRLGAVVALIVPFVCILTPWSIRNTYVHGKFVPISTQAGIQLYISNNPQATGVMVIDQAYVDRTRAQRFADFGEADRDKLFQMEAIEFIRANPFRFMELCLIRVVELWKLYSPRVPLSNSLVVIASFGIAIPFFLLQVIRRGWRRGPEMLLTLIILSHTGLHMVYGSTVRYRIPIEPLVLVMAISSLCWIWGRFLYSCRNAPSPLNFNATAG